MPALSAPSTRAPTRAPSKSSTTASPPKPVLLPAPTKRRGALASSPTSSSSATRRTSSTATPYPARSASATCSTASRTPTSFRRGVARSKSSTSGCTGAPCDGKIHIDFYALPNATGTNFGVADPAGLTVADRALAGGWDQFDGITNVVGGSLLMKWELVAGLQTTPPSGGSDPTGLRRNPGDDDPARQRHHSAGDGRRRLPRRLHQRPRLRPVRHQWTDGRLRLLRPVLAVALHSACKMCSMAGRVARPTRSRPPSSPSRSRPVSSASASSASAFCGAAWPPNEATASNDKNPG